MDVYVASDAHVVGGTGVHPADASGAIDGLGLQALGSHLTVVGDVNGDGTDDLLVGGAGIGRLDLVLHLPQGAVGLVQASDGELVVDASAALAGAVQVLGDLDGNGHVELLIGESGRTVRSDRGGVAQILYDVG